MVIVLFLLGLIIGSFLNVVMLRLPVAKHVNGRSACPGCGRQLGVWDLVPVASFVFLGGKCRGCRKPISLRYPILELVTGLCFAGGAILFPPLSLVGVLHLALFLLVVCIGLATFVIDFEHYLILDVITGFGVVAALLLQVALDLAAHHSLFGGGAATRSALFGAGFGAIPFLFLWLISRGKWLGFGDVKYMIFMGLTLGTPLVWVGMLLGFWVGTLVSLPLLLMGKKKMTSRLPFGTFLVIGQLLSFVWGHTLLAWYWQLFV